MSKGNKSTVSSIVELVVIVAVALGLALLIQAFLVKPYRIPSPSMVPTLKVGQRVLVNRLGNDFDDPHVGEIVVFHPPKGATDSAFPQCGDPKKSANEACDKEDPQKSDTNFIKRVVAGPGDTIYIKDGHVYRNGVREKDSYIAACGGAEGCTLTKPIKIPADHWFMMGDNRGQSDDSRFWGPVPKKWIIGGAFFTYWPPNRIGTL